MQQNNDSKVQRSSVSRGNTHFFGPSERTLYRFFFRIQNDSRHQVLLAKILLFSFFVQRTIGSLLCLHSHALIKVDSPRFEGFIYLASYMSVSAYQGNSVLHAFLIIYPIKFTPIIMAMTILVFGFGLFSTKRLSWIRRLYSWNTRLFIWAIYPSVLELLLSRFTCSSKLRYNKCSKYDSTPGILFDILSLISLLVVLVMQLLFIQKRNLKINDYLTSPSTTVRLMLIIWISMSIVNDQVIIVTNKTYFLIQILLNSLLIIYSIFGVVFTRKDILLWFIQLQVLNFTFFVLMFLPKIGGLDLQKWILPGLMILLVILYTLRRLATRIYDYYSTISTSGAKSTKSLIKKVRIILDLERDSCNNQESQLKVQGIAKLHLLECCSVSCLCKKNEIKNLEKMIVPHLRGLIEERLKNSSRNIELRLFYADFVLHILQNPVLGLSILHCLEYPTQLSLQQQIYFYYLKSSLVMEINENNEEILRSKNMEIILSLQTCYQKCWSLIEKIQNQKSNYWKKWISSNYQSSSLLTQKMQNVVQDIKECSKLFKEIIPYSDQKVEFYTSYLFFLKFVKNKKLVISSQQLLSLFQDRSNEITAQNCFLYDIARTALQPDSILISLEFSDLSKIGEILQVSNNCLQLFGYSRGELEGQNISMLMPAPIGVQHSQILGDFLGTGRLLEQRQEVSSYVMRSDKTLVPFKLFHKLVPDFRNRCQLLGCIVSDLGEEAGGNVPFSLCDSLGNHFGSNLQFQKVFQDDILQSCLDGSNFNLGILVPQLLNCTLLRGIVKNDEVKQILEVLKINQEKYEVVYSVENSSSRSHILEELRMNVPDDFRSFISFYEGSLDTLIGQKVFQKIKKLEKLETQGPPLSTDRQFLSEEKDTSIFKQSIIELNIKSNSSKLFPIPKNLDQVFFQKFSKIIYSNQRKVQFTQNSKAFLLDVTIQNYRIGSHGFYIVIHFYRVKKRKKKGFINLHSFKKLKSISVQSSHHRSEWEIHQSKLLEDYQSDSNILMQDDSESGSLQKMLEAKETDFQKDQNFSAVKIHPSIKKMRSLFWMFILLVLSFNIFKLCLIDFYFDDKIQQNFEGEISTSNFMFEILTVQDIFASNILATGLLVGSESDKKIEKFLSTNWGILERLLISLQSQITEDNSLRKAIFSLNTDSKQKQKVLEGHTDINRVLFLLKKIIKDKKISKIENFEKFIDKTTQFLEWASQKYRDRHKYLHNASFKVSIIILCLKILLYLGIYFYMVSKIVKVFDSVRLLLVAQTYAKGDLLLQIYFNNQKMQTFVKTRLGKSGRSPKKVDLNPKFFPKRIDDYQSQLSATQKAAISTLLLTFVSSLSIPLVFEAINLRMNDINQGNRVVYGSVIEDLKFIPVLGYYAKQFYLNYEDFDKEVKNKARQGILLSKDNQIFLKSGNHPSTSNNILLDLYFKSPCQDQETSLCLNINSGSLKAGLQGYKNQMWVSLEYLEVGIKDSRIPSKGKLVELDQGLIYMLPKIAIDLKHFQELVRGSVQKYFLNSYALFVLLAFSTLTLMVVARIIVFSKLTSIYSQYRKYFKYFVPVKAIERDNIIKIRLIKAGVLPSTSQYLTNFKLSLNSLQIIYLKSKNIKKNIQSQKLRLFPDQFKPINSI